MTVSFSLCKEKLIAVLQQQNRLYVYMSNTKEDLPQPLYPIITSLSLIPPTSRALFQFP